MATSAASVADARAIAKDAYIYLYPLVMMDVTRRQATNVEAGKEFARGPMNSFTHARTFPPADFRDVVRPNFDTLYSIGWLDLTAGPVIVSAPDTAGRYYMLPMLDMWTDVFAVPGKRTTGTAAADFAVVPPQWEGELPAGVQRIDAPTPYVWVIGRIQTNGSKDYAAVRGIQDALKITPLSQWGKSPQPATARIDPTVDMKTPPLDQVNEMPAGKFVSYAAELLKTHPPHVTDQPIIARMRQLGIEVGKSFDPARVDPGVRRALEQGAADGLAAMQQDLPRMGHVVNGWQVMTDTVGVYGTNYLRRAAVAMAGLGANLADDAVYPLSVGDAEGKPLHGTNRYVLHFDKEQLPPTGAFWSVTLYDKDGFPVPNTLQRCAIGDRDALKYNADGSLDLFVQAGSPGKEKEADWLPAPTGPFNLTMRVYAPRPEVLDGRWAPPAVQRVH